MKLTSLFICFSVATVLSAFTVYPAFSQNTDSSEFYFQKGIVEKTAKRFLVASSSFDIAILLNPHYKEAYLESGYVNLAMRKTDIAMIQFNKVLDLEPSNTGAVKELMELYYNYRQYAKAKEMAGRCSDCLQAEKIKAMCSYNEEDYVTAIKELIRYLASNPSDAEATYTLARSYFDLGNYKNAVPFYNKAIVLNGEQNTWTYELGLLYFNLQDYKNAVLFFTKAAEKGYPRRNDFVEALGYAYIFSGQAEQGEKLLLDLLEKGSDNKELIRELAQTFYNRGMYQKSLDYCQQLMQVNMQDGKSLYLAGLCFQKMGQKDKGQGMCDEAIKMDPALESLRRKLMTGF